MIGREEIATTLVTQLSRQRLVTVVGPGGIGKTTVGLAVAERMIGAYEHGVWLVDLAPLGDPGLVPSAVATVLGLEIRTEDPLPGLVAALRDSRMLLLLDNCEHVIDAAAGLAAALLSGASGVNILATSREPLGVPGERVHRLGPLNSPEPSPGLTATEAAAFPAVQLFVERVTAIVEDFALTDANAPLVVAICRRLDGLPLAIEFAAPRVEVLGVEGLAARLDDSLRLLGAQRRAAMPRHRTMRAVVDWSYGLLSEDEQRFFRALGMFAGGFTGEAAAAVAMDAATTGADAIDRLADLVAKSLVVADVSGTKPRFRLLDTTRAYAIEKLDASGERERIARRHAEYYRDLFERAEREVPARPTGEWLADYAREIDNLRAALDWAFSPSGDASIGVALTVAAIPLWLQLPMVDECRSRVEQVFASLAREAPIDARDEMKLQAALGASLLFTKGAIPAARQACYRGSPPRRIARRHRISAESVVGALGSPHEHWRARRRPRRGTKILHPRAGACRPGHPVDRGSDDGDVVSLPGRSNERLATHRADAERRCRSATALPAHPVLVRSKGRGPRRAGADSLAPGFRRPGVAHRAERRWRRGGGRRPGHAVLRLMPRRLPGRAVGGKSDRGGTLRGNAARSFEKARLRGLE